MKHTQGPSCKLCLEKLRQGHPYLTEVFGIIKREFPDCHISWVYRCEEDQNVFYELKKTKLKFPESGHNKSKDDKPCATAFDLFRLLSNGKAAFPPRYYFEINEYIIKMGIIMEWSGNWKSFKETDHFEMKENSL